MENPRIDSVQHFPDIAIHGLTIYFSILTARGRELNESH